MFQDTNLQTTHETLSEYHSDAIEHFFTPPQRKFIRSTLTNDDLNAIDHTNYMTFADYLPIAITNCLIERKKPVALRLGEYEKADYNHYQKTQYAWIEEERTVLERIHKDKTKEEIDVILTKDFFHHDNGLRFRLWYRLRFPDKIKPKKAVE